jgi:hypothetical protein
MGETPIAYGAFATIGTHRRRIDILADNPELPGQLGAANQQILESKFALLMILPQWERFIEELFCSQ